MYKLIKKEHVTDETATLQSSSGEAIRHLSNCTLHHGPSHLPPLMAHVLLECMVPAVGMLCFTMVHV